MQKLVAYSGENVDFSHGKSMYKNPMESVIFSPLIYSIPSKRSRIHAPFPFTHQIFKKQKTTIEILPDECLFEIFKRLYGTQERSSCASVSKHWLNLLSTIHSHEFTNSPTQTSNKSRFLQGKKATDVRLSAIAIGTNSQLGSLSINGNKVNGVTNFGLKAIANGCPSLKNLSLSNLSSISDEGIIEISKNCRNLEKIDFSQIPISNKSLISIAKNCPKLKSISVTNCPQVTDEGITTLLSSLTYSLMKLNLESLNISDMSLAVIGHYGLEITNLTLTGLKNVTEKGFWVMGSGQGLQKLTSLTIDSCHGVTDLGLESLGRGCPNLKKFSLFKSAFLSDNGIVSFAKFTVSLDTLFLSECHRITQHGVFGIINESKLKNLTLESCYGIKDPGIGIGIQFPCSNSVKSVSIRNCPNLTDKTVSELCKIHGGTLEVLNLDGCTSITDSSSISVASECLVLSELDVSGTGITDSGVEALASVTK
ncbi:hypothetical protein LXL04_005314 [Taraxacum kok-saghyz]